MSEKPAEVRLILDDIVQDVNGAYGVVEHISASGRWVMVEYAKERFELHPAQRLTLHISAFNSGVVRAKKRIQEGKQP